MALLQSTLSRQQQQTPHQGSWKGRGLLVSSHTAPNQLHDCMTDSVWNFRTRQVFLGCKRRVDLRILSSVFKHPLNPDHVCTSEAEPLGTGFSQGGKCVGVCIDMGRHKPAPTYLAPALMKEILGARPSTSHDQQCSHVMSY